MAKNPYKLLVVDIDGTVMDRNGTISNEDKKALVRVGDSGIRVSLSTGRVIQSSLEVIDELALDGLHMFFDGALVFNLEKGEEIFVEPIRADSVRQLVEYAHQVGLDIDLYSTSRYFIEQETWATDIRRDFYGLQPVIVDFNRVWQEERIIKGAMVVASAEEKARANDVYLRFKNNLNFSWTATPAFPGVDLINVIAPEVSKGAALEALASFLEIPLSEVMAIGDGANDIPLLSTAGLAVAMGNASDKLKAVADYVTADVDHSGVAAAISKFLV